MDFLTAVTHQTHNLPLVLPPAPQVTSANKGFTFFSLEVLEERLDPASVLGGKNSLKRTFLTLSLDQLNETSIHGRHAAALTAVNHHSIGTIRELNFQIKKPNTNVKSQRGPPL